MIRKGARYPQKLYRNGRRVHLLRKGERIIYASPELTKAAEEQWLAENVTTTCRVETDTYGRWLEIDVDLPDDFTGSAAAGWTNGTINLALQWSADLETWADGGWVQPSGSSTSTLPDGRTRWPCRYEDVAAFRFDAVVDLRIGSNRAFKAITDLSLLGTTISLPNYPYAMPDDAATLQADLRTAGFTGALVYSETGTLSAEILNSDSTNSGNFCGFRATWSGTSITAINRLTVGTDPSVSLPNFPYAMPADEALLEADLVYEGYTYATAMLLGDTWGIFLPDIETTGIVRDFVATYDTGDPMAVWNAFGENTGAAARDTAVGAAENLRAGEASAPEAPKGFGRLKLSLGTG
jgi:hypothetical protein